MPALSPFRFRPTHPPATVAHGLAGELTGLAGSLLLLTAPAAAELTGVYGAGALEPLTPEQLTAVADALGLAGDADALVVALAGVDPRTVGVAVQSTLGVH